ncbi:dTMP kinase [Rubrivivax albus]|uniref:Thymidylate kinase n=1 Tax=Rubrivivax albus TaxID=2499835 RepID=A0A3S2U673_9BURK|nr:dTMP kinase [Rubrivivax albus]
MDSPHRLGPGARRVAGRIAGRRRELVGLALAGSAAAAAPAGGRTLRGARHGTARGGRGLGACRHRHRPAPAVRLVPPVRPGCAHPRWQLRSRTRRHPANAAGHAGAGARSAAHPAPARGRHTARVARCAGRGAGPDVGQRRPRRRGAAGRRGRGGRRPALGRGPVLPGHLRLQPARQRSDRAAPCLRRHAAPPSGSLGHPRARPAAEDPRGRADPGLHHREGDRPCRRARTRVGGLHQPPAHRHAAADRPDHHLRARGGLRRQPAQARPDHRRPLQHLPAWWPATEPDRDAQPGVDPGGPEPGREQGAVLRGPRRRQQPVQRNAGRAQSGGEQVPAGRPVNAPGRFITAEGIDGAGKTTHLDAVEAWLRQRGHGVLRTREPGGTALAETLRELVLHRPMDALTEALLVFAARRDHLQQTIEPALAAGTWVLCDRFTDATFAYQGHGRGFDTGVLAALETWVQQGRQPDLTLWFDVDPAVAAARRSAVRTADRFEAEDLAFFRRVRDGYAARAGAAPARFVRIDAAGAPDTVRQAVLAALETHAATA